MCPAQSLVPSPSMGALSISVCWVLLTALCILHSYAFSVWGGFLEKK